MSGRPAAATAAPPGRCGLTAESLSVGYRFRAGATRRPRERAVLTGLELTARAGELTVLLGPNGAGKSTLLRTLAGLQPALGGSVRVRGRPLPDLSSAERARALACVLTDRVDPGLLSARELVSLGRHPHTGLTGRLGPEDHVVVEWALRSVDAGHLADRPAAELSDGERQRVFTARALAQEPSVVLLDEPTAFLDVPSRVALTVLLRDLARGQGLTVVVSTHDLELALRVADAVWLVDRAGRTHCGAPEDLIRSGAVSGAFDAGRLAFDPVSGSFGLRHRSDSAVTGQVPDALRPLLERALAREGFTLTDGRGDPHIGAGADGRLTVHRAGVTRPVADFAALTREVRAWRRSHT